MMTCGQDTGQEVKRSQSCRTPQRSLTPAATIRKASLVHFHPVHQLVVDHRQTPQIEGAQRQRNFESTKRGRIVNRGDSFRRDGSRARTSQSSPDNSDRERSTTLQRSVTLPSVIDPLREGPDLTRQVLMMGSDGVGKSALCRQFETSEYTNGFEQTVEDQDARRKVVVRLDNVEMELIVEKETVSSHTIPEENTIHAQEAIVVVYSVIDAASFSTAHAICLALSTLAVRRPVIVVANKCDLVRLRKVSAKDGRALAVRFGFKYIETSVVINLNIDELLGGVVAQIQFFQQHEDLSKAAETEKIARREKQRKKRIKSRTLPSIVVKEILLKVVGRNEYKSCENLLIA